MKLALIAAALAGAHAFGEYKDEQKPLAVTIHGAGFRSVLEGAAVARALGEKLGEVTHLGGASGGSWFGALMLYSPDFYSAVIDPDKPIEDVVVLHQTD